MANLLIKLNRYDMAIQVLSPLPLEVKVIPMANVCLLYIIIIIILQFIIFNVYITMYIFGNLQALEKKGKLDEALDLLKQCSYLENQELNTRLNILKRSGEIAHKLNQNDLAVSLYKQALVHVNADSEDANSLKISLAKLFMQVSLNSKYEYIKK